MNPFELYYRMFEPHTQRQQLSLTFTPKIEEIFETLETADIYTTPSHSIIETIFNRNFGNRFQHQNVPNHCQHNCKTIIQQHQHRNTSQHDQHRNTNQQYQDRSFQIPSTSSISFLK